MNRPDIEGMLHHASEYGPSKVMGLATYALALEQQAAKDRAVVELVIEDRFTCEMMGKVSVTHGRFFNVQHGPQQSDVCPICAALQRAAQEETA